MDCASAFEWSAARTAQKRAGASNLLMLGARVGLMSLLTKTFWGGGNLDADFLAAAVVGPRALKASVGLRRERGGDGLFEICCGVFVVADEVLYDAALPVNDEGVRDAVVVGEEEADCVLVGAAELVLYLVALHEVGDFGPVFLAADVEADDLQSLRAQALLQFDEVRNLLAAGRAVCGPEV